MPHVLIFNPDGTHCFEHMDSARQMDPGGAHALNPGYDNYGWMQGFVHKGCLFALHGTTAAASKWHPKKNAVGTESFLLADVDGSNYQVVGRFGVAKFVDGSLVDITLEDFLDAKKDQAERRAARLRRAKRVCAIS